MSPIVRATICGIMGGIFSPVCFLSAIMSGGMSFSPDETSSFRDGIRIGLICGCACALSSFTFWYGFSLRLQAAFSWFFDAPMGQELILRTSPYFWNYLLINMVICIPLSILGAIFSFGIHQR